MPLVSQTQLAYLRRYANTGLQRPYQVLRKTRSETAYGSEETWTQVGSGVGWIRQMNTPKTIIETGMIEGATGIHRLDADVNADIQNGDRIVMEGATFTVQSTNNEDTYRIFCTCALRIIE